MKSTLPILELAVILAMVGAVVACGDDAGPESDVVGGPCSNSDECAGGSHCEQGGDFPDGLCTIDCSVHDDCPIGARCIHKEGGLCMTECGADSDCRGGYKCKEADNEEGGKSLVCKK